MLDEYQFAAWLQQAPDLSQRGIRIGNRAQGPSNHGRIKGFIFQRNGFGAHGKKLYI